ncbi:MAG: sterol desaturase family protein [Elusimicrobiota bacterium]|nr:MAG: sterol desaturase family protein [Elusimicrobiota bacterium]
MKIVALVAFAALVMTLVERAKPAERWPSWSGWIPAAVWLNLAQIAVVICTGAVCDPWLRSVRPWNADALGTAGGAALGYVVITFAFYWWHRARHESDFLWRWFHQVHHSVERLEVVASFYKHPFELLADSLLCSVVLYPLLGLGAEAAAGAMLLSGLAELFYHWNVRTPRWLGFLFQRPESHRLHHESGVHAYNYADLPLWDMLFGTFRNPARWSGRVGFKRGDERRLVEMLAGVDVTA